MLLFHLVSVLVCQSKNLNFQYQNHKSCSMSIIDKNDKETFHLLHGTLFNSLSQAQFSQKFGESQILHYSVQIIVQLLLSNIMFPKKYPYNLFHTPSPRTGHNSYFLKQSTWLCEQRKHQQATTHTDTEVACVSFVNSFRKRQVRRQVFLQGNITC